MALSRSSRRASSAREKHMYTILEPRWLREKISLLFSSRHDIPRTTTTTSILVSFNLHVYVTLIRKYINMRVCIKRYTSLDKHQQKKEKKKKNDYHIVNTRRECGPSLALLSLSQKLSRGRRGEACTGCVCKVRYVRFRS